MQRRVAISSQHSEHEYGSGFVSNTHRQSTDAASARALEFVNTKLATMNIPPMDAFEGFADGLKLAKFVESLSGHRVKVRERRRLAFLLSVS